MINPQNLKGALKAIFILKPQCKDIVQEEAMINQLCSHMVSSSSLSLTPFHDYLQNECGLKLETIKQIIIQLNSKRQVKQMLGKALIMLLIKFKMYEAFQINKSKKKSQRKVISDIFDNKQKIYRLEQLVLQSGSKLNKNITQELEEIVDFILQGDRQQILSCFQTQEIVEVENIEEQIQDKKMYEQLKELQEDDQQYPIGSLQRHIQLQIIKAYIEYYPQLAKSTQTSKILKESQTQSLLKLELKYIHQFGNPSSEMNLLFQKIKTAQDQELIHCLKALKLKVLLIDILELERLVNKTKVMKKYIKEKHVIFFIGNTGSGKSTNILKFLGYNLKKVRINGLSTLHPIGQLQEKHKSFYTSPQAKSCTRYINAVQVPNSMYKKGIENSDKNLFICDSPGFGDSSGIQVDIANGIGMISALEQTKSVRVIVILPYDSLTADRFTGAIKMSETISNLFSQKLHKVLGSIRILFNRVPQSEINQIPRLIQSKIAHLTSTEQSNQKLNIFMQSILISSKVKDNFIDPLNSDYRNIFYQIFEMEPIFEPKQKIRYQFTDSTKKQIQNYLSSSNIKIKNYFSAKKYEYAKFQMKMLYKMKNILIGNEKVKNHYLQITKYIQSYLKKCFDRFQSTINLILNSQFNEQTIKDLEQNKKIVLYVSGLFKTFEIKIYTQQDTNSIIEIRKEIIINQFNDIQKVAIKSKSKAVKIFDQYLIKGFKTIILNGLQKKERDFLKQIKEQLQKTNYIGAQPLVAKILILKDIFLEINESQKQSLNTQITSIKQRLNQKVAKGFSFILQNIIKNKDQIYQSDINNTIQIIKQSQEIQSLKLINQQQLGNKKQRQRLLKQIKDKCKQLIRNLQNINVSLEEQKIESFIDSQKLLDSKKKVEILMKINYAKQYLQQDYRYAKQNIARKIKDNVEILKNGINDLKDNRDQQIYRNLDRIKKASLIVMKCSRIVEDRQAEITQITQDIASQFNNYLDGEKLQLANIQIRLNLINRQSLDKIDKQYKKIQIYAKMQKIFPSTKKNVIQLRQSFHKKILSPFKQFKQRYLNPLKQKKHYKYLRNFSQKLQKFAYYAMQIEEMVLPYDSNQINKINKDGQQTIDYLIYLCKQMNEQCAKFVQSEQKPNPQQIKQLTKTLLILNSKDQTSLFLSKKIYFQSKEMLEDIRRKLQIIFQQIEKNVQNIREDKLEYLRLLQDCKMYSRIDDIYKAYKYQLGFSFRDLMKKIQEIFKNKLIDDQTNVKYLIQNSPSKIDFSSVKEYYDQFNKLPGGQGIRKKQIIISQLMKIQKQLLSKLKSFKNGLEDSNFLNDPQTVDEFIACVSECFFIQRSLNQLYKDSEQDKQKILINKSTLQNVGKKIIKVYYKKFEQITRLLNQRNIANIKQSINLFTSLQEIVQQIFNSQQNNISVLLNNQQSENDTSYLKSFKTSQMQILKKLIQTHQFIDKDEKQKVQNINQGRLDHILYILMKGAFLEIQSKYNESGDNFIIDEGFKKYYISIKSYKQQSSEDVYMQLKNNVQEYFEKLFDNFESNYNKEGDQLTNIKQKIQKAIKNLPNDLKPSYYEKFKTKKHEVQRENIDSIQNLSKNIKNNPLELDIYIKQIASTLQKNQKKLYEKMLKRLKQVYLEKQQKCLDIKEKIKFIKEYFIEPLQRNKHFIKKFENWMIMLKEKFENICSSLENEVQILFKQLSKYISNPFKIKKEQAQDILKSLSNIYNIFIQIKNRQIEHFQLNLQKINETYFDKIAKIIQGYKQMLQKRQLHFISSKQILDQKIFTDFSKYYQYLKVIGPFIDDLKSEVNNYQKSVKKEEIHQKFDELKKWKNIINEDTQTIQQMIYYVRNFCFYDQIKRNMSYQQLREDYDQFQITIDILCKRYQFFKSIKPQATLAYEVTALLDQINNRFKAFIQEAKKQIQQIFNDYQCESTSKINVCFCLLSIMLDKKPKFITKNQINSMFNDFKNLIKNSLKRVRQNYLDYFCIAKQNYTKLQEQKKGKQKQKKNYILKKQQDFKENAENICMQIGDKYDLMIKNETEQAKKNDLANEKTTEINSKMNQQVNQKNQLVQQKQKQYQQAVKLLDQQQKTVISQLVKCLILYKKSLLDVNQESQQYVKYFEIDVQGIKEVGLRFMRLVQEKLNNNPQDTRSIGNIILSSHKIFDNYIINIINRLIKGQNIGYVLQNTRKIRANGKALLQNQQIDIIHNQYKLFETYYDQYKESYKKDPSQTTINYMVTQIKDTGQSLKKTFYGKKENRGKDSAKKIYLLAGIFALWAILKCQIDEDGGVSFTIQPHPTQITTLLLLLGITQKNENLSNRLAQVGTGQGKSIILAGLSTYLAQVGFNVRCACYSAYLSQRDQTNFSKLFSKLGVQANIKYGTFNQLCQDILNNGSNFKKKVKELLLNQSIISSSSSNKILNFDNSRLITQKPTILLIDEVDVFFDKIYFGNTYCPAFKLTSKYIHKLIVFIWNIISKDNNEYNLQVETILNSQQFKDLVSEYKPLQQLLKNQVHGMIAGALNYKHDYLIIDKKLVYKDNDVISDRINYGYKTLFANHYQFEKGNITADNYNKALYISIMVAEFSYAMLPQYFSNILGVTGTLQVLDENKKNLLDKRYSFSQQYYIPSAFGVNTQRVDSYTIVPQNIYYEQIIKKINDIKNQRPIIIFFKNSRELNQFATSNIYKPFLARTSNLTEQHQPSVRNSRIEMAVSLKKITLMTNSFGRGTDFIILNENIRQKGGLHIIQAFLSLDPSQQIQIKGRTARQAGKGSYDCVLCQNWLQQIEVQAEKVKRLKPSQICQILNQARITKMEKLSLANIKLLQEANKKHKEAISLFSKNKIVKSNLLDYINKINLYPLFHNLNVKTILALDATGSMAFAIKKTCQILGQSFQQTYKVLASEKVKASVNIKIVLYRNYNSNFDKIIQSTAYENKPFNLKSFLDGVCSQGGNGNEAIEVLLQQLNKQNKIDQIIIIGDAPANTDQEVTAKRLSKGEKYWNQNGFPSTTFKKQIIQLQDKKIPIHSFYIGTYPQSFFTNLSNNTGGTSSEFKLQNPKVTEELTKFIVENILKIIQQKNGNRALNLVQVYRRMFMSN